MNNLKNSVRLMGRVGTDPQVSNFDGGKKKATFAMATSDYYKDSQGEKVQDTQWHNILAWGPTATFIEKYLKKGKEIAIEGKLVHRSYTNKSGERKYITEVVASEIMFVGAAAKSA